MFRKGHCVELFYGDIFGLCFKVHSVFMTTDIISYSYV